MNLTELSRDCLFCSRKSYFIRYQAQRTFLSSPVMLDAEANDGRTILDYLNEDCWRAVLSYVPARDVMRTERASRRWQAVVLSHLRGVNITIAENDSKQSKIRSIVLHPAKYESFERWTQKLGSSVVGTYCTSWESLKRISKTCPNLQTLKLVNMPLYGQGEHTHNLEELKCLKRLCFESGRVSDQCVSQRIANKALEELEFHSCHEVTGQCLNSINLSNIKTLIFDLCRGLKTEHIVSAVERLSELTQLKLIYVDYELAGEMQLVLDKMPKLEQLEVYSDIRTSCPSSESLCRLVCLRHLKVGYQLGDDDVEAVTRCCKELRSLELLDCQCMTARGAQAICRNAGARLASLGLLGFYELEDDDLVAIVRACPQLTSLNVSGTGLLRPSLPARAAAARREAGPGLRLRLDLTHTNLEDDDFLNNYDGEEYEEMKRQYEDMNNKYENLVIELES